MQYVATPDAAPLGGFRGLRAELLIALKKAPHALTARELAEQFGVTPNALRRHLDALEADALVRHDREVRGVGAPVHAYALTAAGEALFPQEYAPVLEAVLDTLREAAGPEGVRTAIRRQWAPLISGAGSRLAELPLEERAQLVAELRSSQGYMAEAVPEEGGSVTVREHHCAVRDVVARFPEICAAEQELLEELLGVPVVRTQYIPAGCAVCEYVAGRPAAAPLEFSPAVQESAA
ncbi:transcriptional regulator [Gemmatimonadetes bacterium T265]|nr:transcriptional regulator [Gemmatimonadetes bacterium T265]